MKTVNTLVFLILLLLVSCVEETPVESNQNQLEIPQWIQLPEGNGLSIENQFSVTEYIDVEGGELIIDESYSGGPHGEVKVIAKFNIYENTVPEPLMITMTIDNETGVIDLSPSTIFNQPSDLYVKFEGLDLFNVNPEDIDFINQSSGEIYNVLYESIDIDIASGIIELKAPEFIVDNVLIGQNVMYETDSRFGWVR
ncbi:MAG: hypothetical protein KJN64_11255 [Ignavibacteria bacterium]|nr:hypothetical protein [Ignavibacteria bacterium]MBT8381760.1 hypothetical protein [Ignavibacteria bacterium]MBT8391298.1 hypothetical protein [Ignavibacteria bacterium]NNL20800.1 hypothetical protein [Ignavibacteriaceae bacterium]